MTSFDEYIVSKRVTLALLASIVIGAIAFRYPEDLYARGKDTFYIAGFAEAIVRHGSLGWVIHPLSTIGLYPASVASGGPVIFASVALLGDLPVGASIVFTDLVLTLLASLAGFHLGRELARRNWVALGTAGVLAFAPRFVVFTEGSGSSRVFILAIFPLALALFVRAHYHPFHRQSLTVLAVTMVMGLALFHRSFLLAIVVIAAFLVCSLKWVPWDHRWVSRIRVVAYAGAFAGLLGISIVSGLGEFVPRETDYTTGAILEGDNAVIHTANLLLDYASSVGAMAVLVPFGLILLLRRRTWRFETRFLLLSLLVYSPFLVAGQYTILVVLPILIALALHGTRFAMDGRLTHARTAAAIHLVAVVTTAGSSVYMIDRWGSAQGDVLYVSSDLVGAATYLDGASPDAFFISNDWLSSSYKVWSLSGNPAVAWDLSVPLLEGVITPGELDVEFSPTTLSLYAPTSGLRERTHWLTVMTQDPRSPTAQHVIRLYDLRYFLEKRSYENSPTTIVFLDGIHETQYKIWESSEFNLWTIPRV